MGRTAQVLKSKVILIIAFVIIVGGIGGGVWFHESDNGHVQTVTNAQHQITQFSYRGENGVNALAILKKYAQVHTKHYSFGDLVTSINGSNGSGAKYWTFYVNNKEASVGAGSYTTKNSDTITWKLQ